MPPTFLITSFTTWLSHQPSNASDDLLAMVCDRPEFVHHHYLRQLPVDTAIASQRVCEVIKREQPRGVICCGMAEMRSQLTLETHAREPNGTQDYSTSLPLLDLVTKLSQTAISDDAGQFVCEGLYFRVLAHLQSCSFPCWAVFVHVPCLTEVNQEAIAQDFTQLLTRLQTLT